MDPSDFPATKQLLEGRIEDLALETLKQELGFIKQLAKNLNIAKDIQNLSECTTSKEAIEQVLRIAIGKNIPVSVFNTALEVAIKWALGLPHNQKIIEGNEYLQQKLGHEQPFIEKYR